MPTRSREDYLKRVFLLQRQGQAVSMGTLADAMQVAPGSVTGMVRVLVKMGLVEYEPYIGVRLTPAGRRIAMQVVRRHRLIELFLVRTLGLDWAEVDQEAEAIEHVVSEELLERIDAFLGRPSVNPHGDPIPDAKGRMSQPRLQSLDAAPHGTRLRVARVMDQEPEFLRYLDRTGLKPGAELVVEGSDPHAKVVTVKLRDSATASLAQTAAAKLLVEPV